MAGTPLWVKLFGLVIVGLLLVVVVALLTDGGGGHGPQQHSALAQTIAGHQPFLAA